MSDKVSIPEGYQRGDLGTLKAPQGLSSTPLEYAIYRGPRSLVRELLALRADPNYDHSEGFPSLLAALSVDRRDRHELVGLLLSYGANIQQHEVNDCTPLHYAVSKNDLRMMELLLAYSAGPNARMRIDDFSSPLEEAKKRSFSQGCATA